MSDNHTVYKGLAGETTQWEDIQRRLGNLPPKEPVWKPEKYTPESEEVKEKEFIDKQDAEQLSDLEDEFEDDRFLEEYRRKRIAQLEAEALRPRFGTVEEIRGSDFVQQVTEAGPDVWVVVHLYQESVPSCRALNLVLDELAAAHTSTKFLRIISTQAIPNYPNANLPTLLLYHAGSCLATLAGSRLLRGGLCVPEQIALTLNSYGPFCTIAGMEEDEGNMKHVKNLVRRVVQQREQDEDEDSDDL